MLNSHQDIQLTPPEQFGGYRIEAVLGEGAVGTVYRARYVGEPTARPVTHPPTVALKVLKPTATQDPQVLACFHFEGHVLALGSPGDFTLYETGVDRNLLFTAMELIDGVSLDRYLAAKKRLSAPLAIDIVRQTAEALDYLHEHGYAHRDIKPANLMFARNGRVVLFDFGTVIRIRDGVPYETGLYGTPAFLAPEQIEKGRKIDARTDLYALGIALYLLAVGRKPFYGSRADVLNAHLHEEPPPPSKFACITPELEAVILKAIAKEADERFDSGASFARALTEVEQNLPPPRPSLGRRLFGWLRTGA